MKKTISLVLAIVLSMTIFVTNMAGIRMIVNAEDEISEDEVQESYSGGSDDYGNQNNNSAGLDNDDEWQRAIEEAARQADEEAARQAEEEAARIAAQLMQEEEERARMIAEAAEQAAEEQRQQEEIQNYSLTVTLGASNVKTIDFGSAEIGYQRDYRPINVINTGNFAIDLIMAKSNDANGAFSLSLHGDKTHLEPGEATSYNISMRSDLGAGTYTATVYFGAAIDPAFTKGYVLTLKGTVTGQKAQIKSVDITPSKINLSVGSSYRFDARVNGTGSYDDSVRWSITGNRSTGTSISGDGTLTIANDESSGSISVMATSIADTSKTGYATVTPQRNSVNVKAYANPSNGGQVTGGGAVSQGGSVTLSAVPNKNYYFVGWVVDNKTVSTSTNYTINNIQSNMEVVAKFAQNSVYIKAEPNNSNGGTVVGGGTISYGGSTTLSAKAYSGYVFTGWKENGSIISRDASIKLNNLTVDRTITGVFEQTSHTLTVVAYPADGGTVSGGGTYSMDKSATVTASPKDGYLFDAWYVGGQVVSRDASYRIDKVSQDYTLTANFVKKGTVTYEISAGVATTGGTITPSGKSNVAEGTNLTYTITPKSGFAILAVSVDNVQVGAVSTYTFTNVRSAHTISAAFVQTDAGKTAAQASGKSTQSAKVQAIPKTEANTASDSSTVDLNEAASGEGGDEYIEEMELDGLYIPTDDELGVETAEFAPHSVVTEFMGMSFDEIKNMIASGDKYDVLDAAFYTGVLSANVQNDFEPAGMTSVDYSNMTTEELMQVSNDNINPSLPDLDLVVEKLLTNDEVMTLAEGGQVNISVSLTTQEADAVTEKLMRNAVGQKALQYFDLTMLKTVGGNTERVTELPTTMEVVIQIPEAVYSSGKTYSVLRVHNGEVSVLPDLDDDPGTITFRTDRFSSYAIAQQVASARSLVTMLAAGGAVAFGIAATCFLILVAHQRKMRRLRRQRR